MTMFGSENLAIQAFRLGAVDYLSKPFTNADVEQAILRALDESQWLCPEDNLDTALITAETVRQTAVTLSHYINNHLMALTGGLSLLQENLQNESPNHPLVLKVLADSQTSVDRIEQVMRALQQITEVRHIPYYDNISMIDVDAALRDKLDH
jgi:response regulator of citrate/malate metabolism